MTSIRLLLSAAEYIRLREAYDYADPCCEFEVVQTGGLAQSGQYHGIYARVPRAECGRAINLRRFELICGEVFADGSEALQRGCLTATHEANLQAIALAIVHWKMASQRGRAKGKVENVLGKWQPKTPVVLVKAYDSRCMAGFCIGGVRIPTATAFMRLLFPDEYGIMDSRVSAITNAAAITHLSLTADDYVIDTPKNVTQYGDTYSPFLRAQAKQLNASGTRFRDINAEGRLMKFAFRPCDAEMALWQSAS